MSFLSRHYFRSVLTLRISPDPGMQRASTESCWRRSGLGIQLMEGDKAFWGILISHLEVDIQNVSCNLSNATKDKCDSLITVLADILYELVKCFCVNVFEKDRNIIYFLLQKKDFLHLIQFYIPIINLIWLLKK